VTFDEILVQVLELLQREGRVSYRALKRRFALDDEYLEDLKAEIVKAKKLAKDEDGDVLVWTGKPGERRAESGERRKRRAESGKRRAKNKEQGRAAQEPKDAPRSTPSAPRADGERRQLTVLFCDLVDSTTLSERLDPEEYREVVRTYHETCAGVISHYGGHTAQHLGDGLLVYFSYPAAHEDDAQRAVRTGLEITAGLQPLNARLQPAIRDRLPHPIQVRIGIHTGLVVVGEIGSSEKREILALGETPNIAARLQGLAESDTVVISGATYRLVQGLFECQDRGPQELKGISTPLTVYRVVHESEAQSRFEAAVSKGLTPLVGREEELGLLRRRWAQAKAGEGQVVLLSGEPGIGKSRLVQTLKEQVTAEGATRIEFRCSPYHQNSAFYPVIEHLQRVLRFNRDDSAEQKLDKLEQVLSRSRLGLQETVPLLASLLSLPASRYTLPAFSPQKQKQKTQEALVAWIVEEAEKAPVYCAWEDLHWADPSTLELLTLVLDQVPTTRLLALLTFRPDFIPPWRSHSHITQLTLNRLGRPQVEAMVEKVTGGKTLPVEVVQQIVAKTDGVPLFVEELTKMVIESMGAVESRGSVGSHDHAPVTLGIPSTLQDALMARLDQLGPAKEVAQLGATLGREFSYELLQAVSPLDATNLQHALTKLIDAELLYQRGLPPQAMYIFKHALIQDTAYKSLLKSTRQQYHQQIVQILEERFTEVKEAQPELLAHHYTEASLIAEAIPYWQQAGQIAVQRSANSEAISHLTKGLELLKALSDTPERAQQELTLQMALGAPLIATKGFAAPEVERVYAWARELCQRVGETPQLFPVLSGLANFYNVRGEYQTGRELGEQFLSLAQRVQDPALLLEAHHLLEGSLYSLGELISARVHLKQGIALYDPQQHRSHAFLYGGHDPGVCCLSQDAHALWMLGYPDQALQTMHEALRLARELSHSHSLALALGYAVGLHASRREVQAAQRRAEELIVLSREQGFPVWLALGTAMQGWALAEQGQGEEGLAKLRQGITAYGATGAEMGQPQRLALLAEAHGKAGQAEEGLIVLAEALDMVHRTGERVAEARLYRLKGQLVLQSRSPQSTVSDPRPLAPDPQAEAEACFHKAIEIARKQQAKSLELRATTSLARLWQQQGKQHEARNMLSEIYNWFTEGFDTADLQEARALLEALK
jgi:TOMM system kinase/cyclase fusion protein